MGTSKTAESGGIYSAVADNFFTALGAVAGGVAAVVLAPEILAVGVATGLGVVAGGGIAYAAQSLRGGTSSNGTNPTGTTPTGTSPTGTSPNGTQPATTAREQPKGKEPVATGKQEPTATVEPEVSKEPEKPKGPTAPPKSQLLDMANGNKRATPPTAAPEEKRELDTERQRIIAGINAENVSNDELLQFKSDLDTLGTRVTAVTELAAKRGKTAETLLKRLDVATNKAPAGADPSEVKSMSDKHDSIRAALGGTLSDPVLDQAKTDIDQLAQYAKTISANMSARGKGLTGLQPTMNDPAHGAPPPAGATAAEKQIVSNTRKTISASLRATNPTVQQVADATTAIQTLAGDVAALIQRISQRPVRQAALLARLDVENKALPAALPTESGPLAQSYTAIHDGLSALNLTDDPIDASLDTFETDIDTFAGEVAKVEAAITDRAKVAGAKRTAAEKVWADEKSQLLTLVPPDLLQMQPRTAWAITLDAATNAEWAVLQTPLNTAMDGLTKPPELRAAAKVVIDAGAAARKGAWIAAMWNEVGTQKGTPAVPPTRDAIWAWLQWGSIRGTAWNLRILRKGDRQKRELHITVSGNSIPEPSTLIGTDPNFLSKSPDQIFDTMFNHVSRVLRVHVTKGDASGHAAGLNEHLFIGDPCADSDFDGDGTVMKAGLDEFRTKAIRQFTSAKMRGWLI